MTAEPLEVYLEERDLERGLRDDVRAGLSAEQKWLPPKWFYDARGSELFEEITRLPEYYPTRAERAVLAERAPDIAALTEAKTLIELGSGSSEKTRLLLDAFTRRGGLGTFVPLDVSVSALRGSTAQIAADYPGLRVRGIVGDFTRQLDRLPTGGRRLVVFLGGTIGNLLPAERAEFLTAMRAALEVGDWLLLGTDLVKDPSVIVPAYDDAAGVTAEFNRNVLQVINRELGADFDPGAFRPCRSLGPGARVDRDAVAGDPADAGAGVGHDRRLRGGGGPAYRGLGEVPQGGDRRGVGRGGLRDGGVLDGPGWAVRGHVGAGPLSLFTRLEPGLW